MGLVVPVNSVTAEIVLYDTFLVKAIENNNQSFGDINPGETRESPYWYFFYVDSIPPNLDFAFKLNINSSGNLFWQDSTEVIVGIKTVDFPVPKTYALYQNYPNPFNPITAIEFDLPKPSHVHIVIYDLLGRHIKTLMDAKQLAGRFQLFWDGTDVSNQPVASGLYFCRMEAGNFVKVIKLELLK